MAYKWLTLNKNFDRSLGISKIRYDTSINCPLVTDGYFSESPNINTDGKPWDSVLGDAWAYAGNNRFSPYSSRDWYSNRYYGFTDERWSAQTHATLVSGTTYEFVCPLTLYYSGIQHPNDENIDLYLSKLTVYVEIPFGISPENISFDYTGGTSALTITSEEGWTASTENDWLTLSSTTGIGNSTINITAQLNKGQERIGNITVTNGNTNVSCTITQSKYPVLLYCENLFKNGNAINKICMGNVVLRENLFIFNVDMNEIEFEKSGGTEQVVINSTKKWTASAPNWITLSSYSGRSGNITITAESADTSRDGNIVIDNGVNQKIITVNQIVPSYELDLNNGEWIANGEVEGHTLYESTNNGKSSTTYSCYLKFTGQSATLMVQTDGENGYDYVVIEDFGTGSSFWSGRNQTHNMYHTVVCNFNTNGVHTIAIKYRKDGSVNNYTDKGYFYIKEIA